MSDVRWLTYDDIAAAFGLTRESARQLVIRKRWQRRKGNEDTKARIGVPVEELQVRTASATSDEPSDDTGDVTPHDTSDDTSVIRVLTRHIERLEAERGWLESKLATVEADRDAERAVVSDLRAELAAAKATSAGQEASLSALRETLNILQATVDSERSRVIDISQERDRWQTAATERRRAWLAWFRRA